MTDNKQLDRDVDLAMFCARHHKTSTEKYALRLLYGRDYYKKKSSRKEAIRQLIFSNNLPF